MARNNPPIYADNGMRRESERQDSDLARERLELRTVLDTDAGKAVFRRILVAAGVLDGIAKTNAEVYSKTAKQAFGLELLREMYAAHSGASAEIFNRMMQERTGDGNG